jgi:type II pantothenate kinase
LIRKDIVRSDAFGDVMDPDLKEILPQIDSGKGGALGMDLGATLSKLAVRNRDGSLGFEILPSKDVDSVVERVETLAPNRIGLTGGGATRLLKRIGSPCERIDEFAAWGAGSRQLLADQQEDFDESRYLLVSLGTGTSVLLMDGDTSLRVGGTALGGGTVLGLGAGLVETSSFETLCELAERGDRSLVDLVVGDLYHPGEIELPADLTAVSFGKLGHGRVHTPEDLACAIMGLVGENVGLICAGLSYATQVEHIVYGGSTLRNNPRLKQILEKTTAMSGRVPHFLPRGEFGGAVGALLSVTIGAELAS